MTPFLKKTEKSNFYDNCFIISIIAMMGILLGLPYQKNTLISLCTYAIAGCAVIMCICYFLEHLQSGLRQEKVFLLLICVCFFAVLLSHTDIKSDIVSIICFLEIPMFMLCAEKIKTKRPANIFLWVQYILSFYYLYLSQTEKAHFYRGEYGIAILPELTLAYHNPNETSMYLFACFVSLLIAFLTYKRFVLRLMFGVNAALIFRLVWLTQSRAGIISCGLAIVAFVLIKKIPASSFVTKFAITIPWVMVAVLYFFNDKLVEINFLGSSVETGRMNVYDQVFTDLSLMKFLFGDFGARTFNNLHNVYISVFGTIGVLGVILYAYYLSNSLIATSKRTLRNISEKMAYFGVLLFVVYSSVEATFFVGGSAFAMCFIGVYICYILGENIVIEGDHNGR